MAAKTNSQPFNGVILDLNIDRKTVATVVLERLKQVDPDIKAIVSGGHLFDDVMVNYNQ